MALSSAGSFHPGALTPGANTANDAATRLGLFIAVVLLFGVSGGMLWQLGYNYDGLTGSAATKIHPSTYLVILMFAWRSCAFGNPVGYCVHVADQRPATALTGITAVILLAVIVARGRPGMAGMVDTFVAPALVVLMLSDCRDDTFSVMRRIVHVLMTINGLLGLLEFATHQLWFPYRFDGEVFATDLRSSALQGHPLVNAALTSVYVLAVLSGDRSLSAWQRVAIVALQCAALVAFGGRSAMVVTLALGSGYLVVQGFGYLRLGRVNLLGAALACLLAALVPVAVVILASQGFFDALLERFVSDGGSANARVEMFEIFRHLNLRDVIVGPDVDLVESLRRVNGLEWGIENPFVRMTVYQGAFFMVLMMSAFGLFFYEVSRQCERGVWLPAAGWLILMNTSESISSKTTLLTKIVAILLAFYRPRFNQAGLSAWRHR